MAEAKTDLSGNVESGPATVRNYQPPERSRPRLDEETEEKARKKGKPIIAVDSANQPIYEASVLDRMGQRFVVRANHLGPLRVKDLADKGYTGPFSKDQVITRAELGPDAEVVRLCEQGDLLPLPG